MLPCTENPLIFVQSTARVIFYIDNKITKTVQKQLYLEMKTTSNDQKLLIILQHDSKQIDTFPKMQNKDAECYRIAVKVL